MEFYPRSKVHNDKSILLLKLHNFLKKNCRSELPDPCNRLKCYHGAYCKSSPDKISAKCVCPKTCPSSSSSTATSEVNSGSNGQVERRQQQDQPLCGDNGKDYSTKCEIEKDMCPSQRPIKVKFESFCGKSNRRQFLNIRSDL